MTSLWILTFLLILNFCCGFKIDLTVKIPPGKLDCFFQTLPAETSAEVKYQVINGGDLDINFMVVSPESKVYHMEHRKMANSVRFKSDRDGDYKVCFDNTFSRLSSKVVYFEVIVEGGKDVADKAKGKLTFEGEDITDQMDITVQEFVAILDRCMKNLDRSIQIQTVIRVHEAKDRNVQEANFYRVNLFSCFQLVVMMSVGIVLVLMIQRLFTDKMSVSGSNIKVRT